MTNSFLAIPQQTDVLIVGAGPVGLALALALDLGWRGISCLIVDQGAGDIEHARSGLVSSRTVEFCRRWGLAPPARPAARYQNVRSRSTLFRQVGCELQQAPTALNPAFDLGFCVPY